MSKVPCTVKEKDFLTEKLKSSASAFFCSFLMYTGYNDKRYTYLHGSSDSKDSSYALLKCKLFAILVASSLAMASYLRKLKNKGFYPHLFKFDSHI